MLSGLRLIFLGGALLWSTAAQAQWVHHTEDDPFADGNTHLAMAIGAGGVVAGFRCSSPDDLSLVFVTQENTAGLDAEALSNLKMLPMKLLVIVDNDERLSFEAEAEPTPDGGKIRIVSTADGLIPVLRAAQKAKKRFAVATELMGTIGHSKSFKVSGSGRAIAKLASGCRLP